MKILDLLEGYTAAENVKYELAYLRQNLKDSITDLRDNRAHGGEADVIQEIEADIKQIKLDIETAEAKLEQLHPED